MDSKEVKIKSLQVYSLSSQHYRSKAHKASHVTLSPILHVDDLDIDQVTG